MWRKRNKKCETVTLMGALGRQVLVSSKRRTQSACNTMYGYVMLLIKQPTYISHTQNTYSAGLLL